ncbi:MAG: MoxR family ATPase [Actinocatenispora sp.]
MIAAVTGTGDRVRAALDEIERAVVGKRDVLELMMVGVLAGGHLLFEDLPGLGKTLIARSLATVTGLDFTRVQFTPDLLPSDLLGATVYHQATGELTFRPGPVFTQVLLADEINRTPPKTQAALLEAMAESQVSVDGVSRPLPDPFLVLATDNPIEYEGTYPLPEAQLDRFLLRIRVGYLSQDLETELLAQRLRRGMPEATLSPVLTAAELLRMRAAVERVEVDRDLLGYLVAIVNATREHPSVQVGASPRGGLALLQAARARALVSGRDYVLPEDIKQLAPPTLAHRLGLRPEMWARRIGQEEVLAEILSAVPVPRVGRPG